MGQTADSISFRVCRIETYRVKYTIYHALLRCARELEKSASPPFSSNLSNAHNSNLPATSSRADIVEKEKDLRRLIELFDDVLAEEYHKAHKQMPHLITSSTPSNGASASSSTLSPTREESSRITCDFCGTDVFQSFFECRKCVDPSPDAMDTGVTPETASDASLVICSSCYVEGRSCRCEVMEPMQYRPFSELLDDRNMAMKVLQHSEAMKEITDTYEILDERCVCDPDFLRLPRFF